MSSNQLHLEVELKAADGGEEEEEEEEDNESDYDAADDADTSDNKNVVNPNFVSTSENFRFRVGDSVRIPCEVDHLDDQLVVIWHHNNSMIIFNGQNVLNDKRISLDGISLLIRNITRDYEGQYYCQISSGDRLTHNVTILEPPSAKSIPETGFISVHKGAALTLACKVTGNPVPEVTWTREGSKKFHDGKKTMMGKSVTFLSATRHHAGVYECLAENSEGSPAKAILHVAVTHEPEVEVEESIESMNTGYDVELVCVVHAEPKAHVLWFKNDHEAIEKSSRYTQTNSGSRHVLHIDNVGHQDFGLYTCQAKNQHGQSSQTIQLTPMPRLPTLIRNKPLTNGIELEWSTFSKSPVTDYRLRYRNTTSEEWQELNLKSKNVTDNPDTYNHVHQVQRLEEAADYELTIESMNTHGWSQPLTVKFTTLGSHDEAKSVTKGAGARLSTAWWSISTTLVLVAATILV